MPLPVCHLFVLDEGDGHPLAGSLQPCDSAASSGVVNHAHNKPRHLSVMVSRQLCKGPGASWIDISHGPPTNQDEA